MSLLLQNGVEHSDVVREYAQRIDAASQYLLGLINDVLAVEMDAHIRKPIILNQLKSTIRDVLMRRRQLKGGDSLPEAVLQAVDTGL